MKLVEYPDRDMMMIDLANTLAGDIENVLLQGDRASLAVPGGTTPGPIFDILCAADLDWAQVDVMLTDERWVPESSERSNTRLVKERLLTNRAASANWLPLYSPAETPEEKLPELAGQIERVLPISVLLLGMGTDMHTASIFPGADRLADALDPHAPILMPMRAPGAPEPRITLSAHVLNGAMTKHVVITGKDKKEALYRAEQLDPTFAPIKSVWSGLTVHWAE